NWTVTARGATVSETSTDCGELIACSDSTLIVASYSPGDSAVVARVAVSSVGAAAPMFTCSHPSSGPSPYSTFADSPSSVLPPPFSTSTVRGGDEAAFSTIFQPIDVSFRSISGGASPSSNFTSTVPEKSVSADVTSTSAPYTAPDARP